LLTDFGTSKPDPMLLATALGLSARRIGFIVAYRSGLIAPPIFVQKLNTLSALLGGRLSLNVVAGHSPQEQRSCGDFLPHDERYARTGEFLAICNAFWHGQGPVNYEGKYYRLENGQINTPYVCTNNRRAPVLFVAGGSPPAKELAISQGDCWMRLPDTPERIHAEGRAVLEAGKELGLRLAVIVRPTREEALSAARALVEAASGTEKTLESRFVQKSDSVSIQAVFAMAHQEWVTSCLWTGAVRSHGAAAIALVGTPEEVASALFEYTQAGVSQFIISGWPKAEEMVRFGREVLPRLRKMEAGTKGSHHASSTRA